MIDDDGKHKRLQPAAGDYRGSPIIFVTVCAKFRRPWMATQDSHDTIVKAWSNARAWLVGRYVIMPDHVHLFCAVGEQDVDLDSWVKYWKGLVTKSLKQKHLWQSRQWDTRMRDEKHYAEKWDYVLNNPVRHGLVTKAQDWPYAGELDLSV